MAKSNIQNITTTQTFQNWFDKTNEMVDIMRSSALTASVAGDNTTGDAALLGEFTANTVVAHNELKIDTATSVTPGQEIDFIAPTRFSITSASPSAIFQNTVQGGKARYTTGTDSWDVGIDNITDINFTIETGLGGQFSLDASGVLTVGSLITKTDAVITTNLTIGETLTGNTATFNTISGDLTGNVTGNVTGDVFQPDGVTKVFENGSSGIPAQFTGNVLGTVSSLTNHNTNSLSEGSNNLYFTQARARGSISNGTGVSYNSTTGVVSIGQPVATNSNVTFNNISSSGNIAATGSVTADSFQGDGSALTGMRATQLVKAFITFDGSTGATIASSDGLTISKIGTGQYRINIPSSSRPPSASYGAVVGNVDQGTQSLAQSRLNGGSSPTNYNAWIHAQTTSEVTVYASRTTNTITGLPGDDNHSANLLGISAVDPRLITVLLMW